MIHYVVHCRVVQHHIVGKLCEVLGSSVMPMIFSVYCGLVAPNMEWYADTFCYSMLHFGIYLLLTLDDCFVYYWEMDDTSLVPVPVSFGCICTYIVFRLYLLKVVKYDCHISMQGRGINLSCQVIWLRYLLVSNTTSQFYVQNESSEIT